MNSPSRMRLDLGRSMRPTPVVLALLVALTATYIVSNLLLKFSPSMGALVMRLPLSVPEVLAGEVWRIVTYGFVHDFSLPTHLLYNAMTLFFFGPDLERRFGAARFFAFCIVAVVAGAACVIAGQVLGLGGTAVMGFSAACQAMMVAWGAYNWDRVFFVSFVIPLKGKHAIGLSLVMFLLDAVSFSATSAAAHLGGIIVGAIVGFGVWSKLTRRLRRKPHLVIVPKNDHWVN